MKRLFILPLVALALAGCDPLAQVPALDTPIPAIPAALRKCIESAAGVNIPRRALTVGEIERLWKSDRVTIVVLRKCGRQLIAFHDTLRKGWR